MHAGLASYPGRMVVSLSTQSEYEANTGYNRGGRLENSRLMGSVAGTVTTAMLAVGGEDSSSIGGAGGMLEG